MAVAESAQDAYDVAKKEFQNHETAFKRLETSLPKALAALSAAPQETNIENRAAAWRKRAMLAEGYQETPPASEVERCVRLILGATSGRHIVPTFVDLINSLAAPDTKE